ncbi:MAG: hypothetical protein KBB55_02180 [Candidatus Buchananbacteria bacterium]|nr:hypothetical protein [Candidatus Buchananbacteria bacterium]
MLRVRRFFKRFHQVKLHQHERDAMREHLSQFINNNPSVQRFAPPLNFWQRYSLVGALAAVILCVIGVSTSVVAEDALPGEFLYAIKVKFNEPLTKITAVTPESEVEWQINELDRRLTEVDKLTERQQTSTAAAVTPQVIKRVDAMGSTHQQAIQALKARHQRIFLASSTAATTTPVAEKTQPKKPIENRPVKSITTATTTKTIEKHLPRKPTGAPSVKSTSTRGLIDVKGDHQVELKLPALR